MKYGRKLTEGLVELPPLVCRAADIDLREGRKAPYISLRTAEEVHQHLHGHGSRLCQHCSQRGLFTIRTGGRDGVHTGKCPIDRRGERKGIEKAQVSAPERCVLKQIAIRYRTLQEVATVTCLSQEKEKVGKK